ncbi:hypothetical protein [uncultured Sphingomonas sp.]|uniref:hypothetical protein n=1 Tax=uncultured Sphingomonas sp. TaxID=158754 RepID=UPI0037492878
MYERVLGVGVETTDKKPRRKLGRMGCGVALGLTVLLGLIGALAGGDGAAGNSAGPAAPGTVAKVDATAEARQTFVANYKAVLTATKPCDATINGIEAAAKSGSPLTLYQAAKVGQATCQDAWQKINRIEAADLPDAAAEKEKAALKTCGTAYFLRQRAMETAMAIADGDAKPSKLSSFQEDMRDGQAAVMMCVAQYLEASEPAGVTPDNMKL